jgi:uncharacterized membrane protein
MFTQLLKYLTIVFSSALKFIFGPAEGLAMGLPWLETFALTVAGMMLSVVVVTYSGDALRNWLKSRKKKKALFSKSNRQKITIWQKYGIYGVAFLTPLLLTPIGGTILAVSFGEKKSRIFIWMLVSAIVWSLVFTLLAYEATDFLRSLGLKI